MRCWGCYRRSLIDSLVLLEPTFLIENMGAVRARQLTIKCGNELTKEGDGFRKEARLGSVTLNFLSCKKELHWGISFFNIWFCSVCLHMWVEIIQESLKKALGLKFGCEGQMRLKWGIRGTGQPEQKYGDWKGMGIPRESREGWDLPSLEEEEGENGSGTIERWPEFGYEIAGDEVTQVLRGQSANSVESQSHWRSFRKGRKWGYKSGICFWREVFEIQYRYGKVRHQTLAVNSRHCWGCPGMWCDEIWNEGRNNIRDPSELLVH